MSVTLLQLKVLLCGTDGTQGILQDNAYYSGITTRINDAVKYIAGGVHIPKGYGYDDVFSPPLPNLFSTDTVDTATDAAYVSLPDTFQRSLEMVADENGYQIFPPRGGDYESFGLFMRQITEKDLSETGDVVIACANGNNLFYQAIPSSAETLTLHFYRLPVDMSDDTDTVDGIPDRFAKDLIAHRVLADIYGGDLEDGDNSMQKGFKYHESKFYQKMVELIMFIGISNAKPQYIGSDSGYDEY